MILADSETSLTGELRTPLFVTAIAISATGVVAAGIADGRLWIGLGGESRLVPQSKKRNAKWRGLREEDGLFVKVAEGPIVALSAPYSLWLPFCADVLAEPSLMQQYCYSVHCWGRQSNAAFAVATNLSPRMWRLFGQERRSMLRRSTRWL